MQKISGKKGVSLVEAVIGISIMLVFVVGIASGAIVYLKLMGINSDKSKSALLMEEGLEAVRVLRDTSWSTNIETLSTGTSYWIIWNGSTYEATTTPTYIDGINRYMTVETVERDASDNIAVSGTLDEKMRKVMVNVEWFANNATSTISAETYISNRYEN